jgi:decaprenylphospho-beta-D-erythro-pentofuranosid-2-ulose 2-reductase
MNVLILGATSTVAADVARIYRNRGARFYLVARSRDKLAALSRELGTSVIGETCVDFLDSAATSTALRFALDSLGVVDLALIAHGDLGNQSESETDFAEAQRQLLINYVSVVCQLTVLGPFFEEQGRGTIAVISSVAGERGRPRNYTYGSAKGGLSIYLQGLRSRLWQRVGVITIKLGPVDTPMTRQHEKNALFVSSERAARGIVRAIARRRGEVYVPGFWRIIMLIVRNLPESVFQRLAFLSGR